MDLGFKRRSSLLVRYDDEVVGTFAADLLVNDSLIVEVKAIQSLAKPHESSS